MRKFTLTPLFGALLALTPVATAQTWTAVQIELEVTEQFNNMQEQARAEAVKARDVARLSSLFGQWIDFVGPKFPSACELDRRLQSIVGGLEERAHTAFVRLEHVTEAQEQWIDALLDRKMFQLKQAVQNGRLGRKLYYKIVRLLHQRADAAVDDPDAEQIRDRLIAAVDKVMTTTRDRVKHLNAARLMLIRERYNRAVSLLTKYAQINELTRTDYNRVVTLWADWAKAAANESFFPTCED